MPLSPVAEPRKGKPLGFCSYPQASAEFTLGNPETIIWSSIRHLCSQSAAEFYAWKAHGISSKKNRLAVARNLKVYVQQAYEFYEAAENAKANTAPLIYYYSFLNLAKALCEMRKPRLHRRDECYAHGLSWRPDPRNIVRFAKEHVTLRGRGIWHLLWESIMLIPCPAADRTKLQVMKLFSYCPEISVEYGNIFGGARPSVGLENLGAFYDKTTDETWLRFSTKRETLRSRGLSAKVHCTD